MYPCMCDETGGHKAWEVWGRHCALVCARDKKKGKERNIERESLECELNHGQAGLCLHLHATCRGL